MGGSMAIGSKGEEAEQPEFNSFTLIHGGSFEFAEDYGGLRSRLRPSSDVILKWFSAVFITHVLYHSVSKTGGVGRSEHLRQVSLAWTELIQFPS